MGLPADVAQLVEHFTRNEGVPGSSPGVGSVNHAGFGVSRSRQGQVSQPNSQVPPSFWRVFEESPTQRAIQQVVEAMREQEAQ
jgi:hypothetical protein